MFGAGSYDVMGNMWGYASDQENVAMGAVSKYFLNWLDVIEITSDTTVAIEPSCTSNKVYKITHNLPHGEFFLVSPSKFDTVLAQIVLVSKI